MLIAHDPAFAFVPYPAAPVPHASTGPLAGLSFAVKDLFDVAGYPTSGGNPHVLARSGIKTRTAPTVQRLLDAGATFLGKTYTDELAFSMNGKNAHFGTPVNGGAPDRIPGGSSSGSASAVSNNLVDFALGTDTGGSVRTPSNHCGLYGIRPTHGRVSLEGALDLAPSQDTCGFFAREATTFGRVADVLLGADTAPLPEKVRLIYASDYWEQIEGTVQEALAPALASVESALGAATRTAVAPASFDAMYWAFRYIQGREAWHSDGALIESFGLALGPGVKDRFLWSKGVTDAQFEAGVQVRKAVRAAMAEFLGQDGVLVMPTAPDIAPLLDESEEALEDYRNRAVRLLCLAGLTGFPQISLPLASRLGAPLGISLLGPAGSDRSLIALAEKIAATA